jgi:diguanylate cyclase (GGDEF)-like protein/PAS domain S-box-containing protein
MKWPGLTRLDGYLSEGMEREYRLYYLKDDTRTASISMVFLTILLVAFAYNDYVLFGFTPTFYYLIALRSIYLVYNIALIIFLWNNRSPLKFDVHLFIWLILSGSLVTAINLTRPAGYIGNVPIDVILILIVYLGVPMRLMFRTAGGMLFMLAETLDLLFFHGSATGAAFYASVVGLFMANIIGIYASSRLYSFRRSEFKARDEGSHAMDLLTETGKMASVGGWEFDVKTRLQTWTDEVYRIHELEPGHRITVDDAIKFYAAEAVPVISEAVQHAIIFGEPFDLELPLITAKGNRRWVHAVGKAYSENGLITRVGGTIQDITAVKKAEDIIKRTSEQWQATFDAISDLVSIQDKDFKLVRVNKAYADAFQVRPEELIGRHCYEIVHNSSVPIPNCPHEKALACKSGVTEEVFEPLLGMYMEVSCSPIFSEQGELEGTVHIVKDITERKKADEKLRESEKQYHEMIDFLPISTFEIDTTARLVTFNQTALKVFGYSEEDYQKGMNAFQFFSPEELQRFGENFGKVMEGKSIPGDEYIFLRKDGSTFIGLIYAAPVFRQNKLAGVRGTIVDITRRKQAEEQLKESEEQLRNSLENAPDGVYMNDFEGNFLYGNLKCEEITGYKREELIGKNFLQLNILPENSLARAAELLQDNINGKSTGPDELELISKDGRPVPVEINTSVVRRKGQPIVLAFVRDITERKKIEEERQKAAVRIENLYNNAPAGYHSLDKDGTFVGVNDTELAWLGYVRDELVGKKKFTDFLTAESREVFQREFPGFKERGWVKDVEFEVIRKDSTTFSVLVSATAVKDEAGNFLMSRTTLFDITEVKRLQKAIAESEKRFRTILEEMNDSYFELDLVGNFTFVNNAFCRVLRVTREEVVGANFRSISILDEINDILAEFIRVRETGEPHKGLIFRLAHKDGVTEFAEISISPQKDERGNVVGYRCVGRDVTKRMELQNKLAVLAMHDALTGLPNRSLLYDRFGIAWAQAQRSNRKLAVMELDLDRFKTINDTLGHAAGDELLKATADRLSAIVRKSDTVARLGGDEFVVLIPEFTNVKDILKTAQKILTAFQKPFVIDGQELQVTTSIGIAVFPRDGSNIEDLLKAADAAMYYTKEHGRNSYKLSGDKARA